MSGHPPTSRPKAVLNEELEATSDLKLGEMQNLEALTVSETALILDAVLAKRKKNCGITPNNHILQHTLDYVDTFSRFKSKESVEAVERLLAAYPELAKFERAQLGTLGCTDTDEAKTLIPSLANKISDQDLQELLDEMAKLAQ